MDLTLCRLLLLSGLLGGSGCFHPWSLRLPTVWNDPPEVERREYQYHDPFPDSQTGPSVGFRPLSFDEQRPLPVRIREKYDVSLARQLSGVAVPSPGVPFVPAPNGAVISPSLGPSVPPPVGPSPSSQYPLVVPY
jgi:hypothetical protein